MKLCTIAGIDEAGRGPWAGPVVSACVLLPHGFPRKELRDSKKLSENKREELYALLCAKACIGIGLSEAHVIDEVGIKKATHLAMLQALTAMNTTPKKLRIDGNDQFTFPLPATSYIKGDDRFAEISAASIIAKVFRDQLMHLYDSLYPGYYFSEHKGYGTKKHQESLSTLGVSPIHRKTFAPIASLL